MREINIKIIEHAPDKLRVVTYFGDEKTGSKAENVFTEHLHPLILESLRIAMPQCLTGQGSGDTMEEAQAKCDLESDIHEAGGTHDRPKP